MVKRLQRKCDYLYTEWYYTTAGLVLLLSTFIFYMYMDVNLNC